MRVAKLHRFSSRLSALSPNGRFLVIGDKFGNILGFDTKTADSLWSIYPKNQWLSGLYVTDDGVLGISAQDEFSLYRIDTGERLAHLRSENRWWDCWIPEEGQIVYVGSSKGGLHRLLWQNR